MDKLTLRRLERLERELAPVPAKPNPDFERRFRIARVHRAWLEGKAEKPKLGSPEDERAWKRMDHIVEIARRVTARRAAEKERSEDA